MTDEKAAQEYTLIQLGVGSEVFIHPTQKYSFEIQFNAHLAGQEHGAKMERERIWAEMQEFMSEDFRYVPSSDIKRIIYGEGDNE